ncbi:hypothetical protein G6F16_013877 [Rhizopus arrhizus]|nr:hypothetical protein G6F16_013877 [Rhizopus arrhizus]
MLLRQNPLWSNPQYTGGYASVDDRLAHLSTDAHVKQSVLAYRKDLLHRILNRPDPPVLLSACRPSIGIDGMFFIPMLLSDRSRILRWRMGWLPARPIDCSCGPIHASRAHLLSCLRVAERLNLPADIKPNPLDYHYSLVGPFGGLWSVKSSLKSNRFAFPKAHLLDRLSTHLALFSWTRFAQYH